jgi:hypothetical protein
VSFTSPVVVVYGNLYSDLLVRLLVKTDSAAAAEGRIAIIKQRMPYLNLIMKPPFLSGIAGGSYLKCALFIR